METSEAPDRALILHKALNYLGTIINGPQTDTPLPLSAEVGGDTVQGNRRDGPGLTVLSADVHSGRKVTDK